MDAPRKLLTLLDVPEAQRRPMTREVSEAFIRCSLGSRAEPPRSADEIAADIGKHGRLPAQLAILSGRLRAAGPDMRFSTSAVLFLASLCASPGRCVLWAHYLVTRTRDTDAIVDVERLATDFPNGFPTDEGALAIWDAQKRRRDEPAGPENCLDSVWAWREMESAHG